MTQAIRIDRAGSLWLATYCSTLEDLIAGPLEGGSVDVIVTSPPYKKKDGWTPELMRQLGVLAGNILKPGGRMFLNVGQLREDLARPFRSRAMVEKASGLKAGQTIAWIKSMAIPSWREVVLELLKDIPVLMEPVRKALAGPGRVMQRGHYQPLNTNKVLNYAWEPIFTFYKPPEPDFDRLAIGVAFADKTNLKRGDRGKHGDLHCAGDTWFLPYKTTGAKKKKATAGSKHAYEFPEALVERCLKVAGLEPGAVVCDPFVGSGSTPVVAKRLGFSCYGVDMDAEILSVTRDRWISEGQ